MLDYGFSNYEYKQLAKKGDILKSVEVTKGVEENLNLIVKNDVGILLKKGQDNDVEQTVELNENISAPIQEKQKLGEIVFKLERKRNRKERYCI